MEKYLREVLGKNKFDLLKMENVVAVGVGIKRVKGRKTEFMSVVCSVKKKVPEGELRKKDIIPKVIDRIKTDVVEVGEIKALNKRTRKYRPAPGGVSIGHEWITAGTLGCLVKKDGLVYILSNNHVLADSNNAPLGSPILQPGKYDGGEYPRDRIATLSDYVPILFLGGEGCPIGKSLAWLINLPARLFKRETRLKAYIENQPLNYADAAIAKPVKDDYVIDEIMDVGKIAGLFHEVVVGMTIKKSGRTTELTEGEIEQTGVLCEVSYGNNKTAIFDDQIMAGKMCAGGDSGSAVLNMENKLVGLLFAGSDKCTVINPIFYVFDILNLSL